MKKMKIILIIISILTAGGIFVSLYGLILSLKSNKKFINCFRVVKYGEWYCIQQKNEVGDWYFIRNVSIVTAERSAIMKKHIIREIHPNDFDFFYDEKTVQEIVKKLRKNWYSVAVVLDK